MALKALLESIEGNANASLYKEIELEAGKKVYVLDVEPENGFALENVSGLKSALEKTKGELQKRSAALDGFKDLDAQSVRSQLAELEQLRKGGTDDEKIKQQIESIKQQLSRKHQDEIKGEKAVSERYQKALDEALRQQAAVQALADAGGNATLLLPHVLSQTKVRDDNGRFVVDVVGNDGTVRIKDANSNMSIADLVTEMRSNPIYAPAFSGTNKSGSGSQTGITGSAPIKLTDASSMADKKAFYRAKQLQT